jgi:hypothetical protein
VHKELLLVDFGPQIGQYRASFLGAVGVLEESAEVVVVVELQASSQSVSHERP